MKRHIEGLHQADQLSAGVFPDGLFLVRVEQAQYRWQAKKPHYVLRFRALEPKALAGHSMVGRLYCTPKALWKLNWFLRDFGYDTDLLSRDEIDERTLVGLTGVVKISHVVLNGTSLVNLEGFAPATQWQELRSSAAESAVENKGTTDAGSSEVA